MTNRPDVSLIMPVYNVAPWIGEALNSVAQAAADVAVELVVVDDGSTDDTLARAEAFAARHTWAVILRQGRNAGVSAARNRGIAESRGEWIAFLDGDDRITADSLSLRLAAARSLGNSGLFLGADFRSFSDAQQGLAEPFFMSKPNLRRELAAQQQVNGAYIPADPVALFLRASITCHTGTVLVHRSALHGLDRPFDPGMTHSEDEMLWLTLAQRVGFAFLPEVVLEYRLREGSATTDLEARIRGRMALYRRLQGNRSFRSHRRLLRRRRAHCHLDYSYLYSSKPRHRRDALSHAVRSLLLRPRMASARQLVSVLIGAGVQSG